MSLYSFNKVSWRTGYDNKSQHFEKWRSAAASYDNKSCFHFSLCFSTCMPIKPKMPEKVGRML